MSSISALAYNLGAPQKMRWYVGLVCTLTLITFFLLTVFDHFGLEAMLVFYVPMLYFAMFTTRSAFYKLVLDHTDHMVALIGIILHIEFIGLFKSLICFLVYWTLYLMDGRIKELMEENENLKKMMEEMESMDDMVVFEEMDLSVIEMTSDEEEEDFDYDIVEFEDNIIPCC